MLSLVGMPAQSGYGAEVQIPRISKYFFRLSFLVFIIINFTIDRDRFFVIGPPSEAQDLLIISLGLSSPPVIGQL